MDLGLHGKTALITGSHRGTGSVIAETLAAEGAHVWLHGLSDEHAADAQRFADGIREHGGIASTVIGDLHTDAGADTVSGTLERAGAPLDILINNYGGPAPGSWQTAGSEDWRAALDQNLLSATRMIQRFVPGMRERGHGRIIQLATIGAVRPNPNMPHYYAAKTALASIAVSLSQELAGTGITVNTVSPGLIHTAEVEAGIRQQAKRRDWEEKDWPAMERRAVARLMPNPCQRMATRREVADLIAFLASARAAYINGAHLRIDGGATGTVI